MNTLLGIDLGVSFVKAGLYDENGQSLCSAKAASPGEHQGKEIFIQKGDDYLAAVFKVIQKISVDKPVESKNIAAITFSGQLAGAVGIDKNWNDCTTCSSNMDTRYTQYVEKMISINRHGMSSLSGTNYPYWGAKLLWWKEEFPALYKKVDKFIFLGGYIIGKLCGLKSGDAFTDPTYLEMSGLSNLENHSWSDDLCDSFSLDLDKLPIVVNSYDVVGYLSTDAAAICGITQGIPVVAGAGDKPAGAFGAGIVEPGMMVDESASFGALSMCTDSFVPDTEYGTLEIIPSPVNGLYYPTSVLLGSGITQCWFLKTMGENGIVGNEDFSLIEEKMAALPPGSEGLIAIGLLDGRAYPCEPDVRGLWIGHGWMHRKEHFYRALLESYAYEYKYFLKVLTSLYKQKVAKIRAIGGGENSGVWNQIKTDVLGVPYSRTNRDDHALLGDIILGGHSVGIFPDLKETAGKFCTLEKTYKVNEAHHKKYDLFYHLYLEAIEKNRELFTSLRNID